MLNAFKAGMDIVQGSAFWLIMLVFAMFLVAICTAAYNDDKTAGL
ncbi:hypothetical protein ACFQWB_00235 [Paenibacillus thermoaerophilus]|uniref:Uncharacterized protein n=1 Tax=Paenibacillus thermoaerophilus TaxID=1215385 RepID=A0ABW2UWS9_9BACL|nr:hypothetical protein [Paenibacillus thermoaerophilus]